MAQMQIARRSASRCLKVRALSYFVLALALLTFVVVKPLAKHADRFPMLNKPDPRHHGAVWTQAVKPLGPIAYILKARVTMLRDVGAQRLSPPC
jgi:hypothetical protein